jgi:hypothetical protein
MMHGPSGDGDSRRWPRGDAIAREVPVPSPFALESFGTALERWRRRPLMLAAIPLPTGRHAMWVETASRDYILYEPSLPLPRQVRAIAHQAGHMCADHRGVASGGSVTAALFPGLDPAVVAAELPAPTAFTDAEELDAEAFADVLLARIVLPPETDRQHSGQPRRRIT